MKETLILLTGSMYWDNLIDVAKSINIKFDEYNNIFDIKWIICLDQYNGHGKYDNCIEYLKTTNIDYKIYKSGKPNQKNYGGSLFNEPLQQYVKENNLNNPWVYILDDDNIVHPNLYRIFNICLENDFYGRKEIITTINKWDTGHNREINREIYLIKNSNDLIQEWFLFDPSQVILRYSIIEKYDFILDDLLYDFYWLNMPTIENEQDNTIWFNEYEHSYGRHIIGTYHDGLVKYSNIEELVNSNIDNLNIDILLANLDIECPKNIPILKSETKKKIIELIKQDINEN